MSDVVYRRLTAEDAGEALTVQRAAFVAEAWIHGTAEIPPLRETFEEMQAELETNIGVGGFRGTRLVASARLTVDGTIGWVSRVAVAPDQQGRGIGFELLNAVEAVAPPAVETFQLAAASDGNVKMYERRGYVETGRMRDHLGVELTVMGKPRGDRA